MPMDDTRREAVKLQAAGARPDDVGRGVARVPREVLRRLSLSAGDVIELIGERHTAAIALPLLTEDEGLDVIRLDGLQRANAGVSGGDPVEVRAADARA